MSTVKALSWLALISVPSILASAYVVFKIRQYLLSQGGEVNEELYLLILFIVMWGVMWITSRRALKSIFSQKPDEIAK
jgi:hypothetical protein